MFLKPMLFIEGVVALHRGSCLYFLELFFFFFWGYSILYFLLTSAVYVYYLLFV